MLRQCGARGACRGASTSPHLFCPHQIGASANIVTATLAERAGHRITFTRWLWGGIPVMIVR